MKATDDAIEVLRRSGRLGECSECGRVVEKDQSTCNCGRSLRWPTRTTSQRWRFDRRFGRIRMELTIYRHTGGHLPDRWVIAPAFVYDRKR